MALLIVAGGPTPPAGRTLTAGTRLSVTFATPYHDGTQLYPRQHHAELDTTTGGWKPVGSADETPFIIPGAALGEPLPPPATLLERQVYPDGEQSTIRPVRRILETAPGTWYYASLLTPLLAGTSIGRAGTTLGFAGAPVWPIGGES